MNLFIDVDLCHEQETLVVLQPNALTVCEINQQVMHRNQCRNELGWQINTLNLQVLMCYWPDYKRVLLITFLNYIRILRITCKGHFPRYIRMAPGQISFGISKYRLFTSFQQRRTVHLSISKNNLFFFEVDKAVPSGRPSHISYRI
jgi:hypothetical protein